MATSNDSIPFVQHDRNREDPVYLHPALSEEYLRPEV